MSEAATVAVTGAAGSVGGFIIDLLREKGYGVIAIDLPSARLPEPGEGLEVRAGDLTDRGFCESCLVGADHVIHTAAVIDISWTYEQLRPINVDAVRNLYEAARKHRALTFVHFSSGSIYDHGGMLVDEETPLKATSPYEQTKIESEEILRSYHGKGGPAYVILRPSLIYGPRGRLLGAQLVTASPLMRLFTGEPVLRFVGGPRLNWVHAEDVARAAVFCMEHEKCWGQEFNVADDTPLPFGDVINAASKAYGLPMGRTVPVPPKWVTRIFYRFIDTDLFFNVINGAGGPLWDLIRGRYSLADEIRINLDRSTASYFVKDVIFDNKKLRSTGFEFKWPDIRTAFAGVLTWYQDQGWAPRLWLAPGEDIPDTWGFQFRQRLSGTFSTRDGCLVDRPLEFNVTGRAKSVRRFIVDNVATLRGTIDMEGFATAARLEGTLEAALLRKGKFIYEYDFTADDGTRCHFRGVEDVEPANLLETMTTMDIDVTDEAGRPVAEGSARFDIRADLLNMAASMRPRP
jgi:nucleoside-diphosphate-sugar epimerase